MLNAVDYGCVQGQYSCCVSFVVRNKWTLFAIHAVASAALVITGTLIPDPYPSAKKSCIIIGAVGIGTDVLIAIKGVISYVISPSSANQETELANVNDDQTNYAHF